MASKNLFIGWSGDLSKKIAQEFNDWIPSVIQAIKPYFSPDMKKGIFWGPEINKQLSELKLGILIITPDNKDSTWIHYEAGGLISKLEDKDIVCPICFNLKPTDLAQPLGGLNATDFSKDEILKLLNSINSSLGDSKLDAGRLKKEFERKWQELEDNINEILSKWKPSESTPKLRSSDEMIEEILTIVRSDKQREIHNITGSFESRSGAFHSDYVFSIRSGKDHDIKGFLRGLNDQKNVGVVTPTSDKNIFIVSTTESADSIVALASFYDVTIEIG